ncbi:MAG: hypothetical protein KA518_03350 [Acinetobacter sp.]|nr:hypothetical protein [Acinetobacter sp.]
MGFEYKILVDLTQQQSLELQNLILEQPCFSRKSDFKYDYIEFRHPNNLDQKYMPNLRLLFEADGIYICNNSTTSIWDDLTIIRNHIETNHLTYRIFDYSD